MTTSKPRLFTYTIPADDGAAPNPFNGMCTLAICKPKIRSVAKRGDWVAGLGSKDASSGDLSGCLVYAMEVEEVMSLAEYDRHAAQQWPHRIPNVKSLSLQERLGDCIYDFSSGSPRQRPGVHGPGNKDADLNGKNVLISRHFFYFGAKAIPLPEELLGICHQTQGHKSNCNEQYFAPFVDWIKSLSLEPGQLYGWPDYIVDWDNIAACGGCTARFDNARCDVIC